MQIHISDELAPHVRRSNCDIIPNTDGEFTLVDQNLTTQVASGTKEELTDYLSEFW